MNVNEYERIFFQIISLGVNKISSRSNWEPIKKIVKLDIIKIAVPDFVALLETK